MKKLIAIRDNSEIKVGDIIKGKYSDTCTVFDEFRHYEHEFINKVQLYVIDTELSPEVEGTPHINKNEDTLCFIGINDTYHEEDWNRVIASTDTSLGLLTISNVQEALDLIGKEVEAEYVSKVKIINPACGDFGEVIEIVPDFFGKKDQWYDKNRPNCFYDREELEFGYSEVIVKPKKTPCFEFKREGRMGFEEISERTRVLSHYYKKGKEEGKKEAEKETNDSYAEAHLKGYVAAEESMKPIIKQLNKTNKEIIKIKLENQQLMVKLSTLKKKYFRLFKKKEELEDLIEHSEKAMFTKEGILEVYDMYLKYQRKEKEIIPFREFVEMYVKY